MNQNALKNLATIGFLSFFNLLSCADNQSQSTLKNHQSGSYVGKISAVEANVWRNGSGEVVSDMGPSAHLGCHDSYFKQRNSKQGFFYIAPSDALMNEWLGRGECTPNPHGGEPACEQYRDLCGAVVAIVPREGDGQENLSSRIINGKVNNAMGYSGKENEYRDLAHQSRSQIDYLKDEVPTVIYAVINDFCPRLHSVNAASNNCSDKQLDLGPGVWFSALPGYKVNPQGWLDPSSITLNASLVKEGDGKIKKVFNNEWILGPRDNME